MKPAYINNIPVAHGEVTVVMGDHAEKIKEHSCSLAGVIQQAGVGVLLLNCGMSDRRFRDGAPKPDAALRKDEDGEPVVEFYKNLTPSLSSSEERGNDKNLTPSLSSFQERGNNSHLVIHSSVRGDLLGDMEDFDRLIGECGIGVIIISGWEWAASTWRQKERLLYRLRDLMDVHDVAVIVYSQNPVMPTAGMLTRGSIGKLALLALSVTTITASAALEEVAPKPPPIVTSLAEMEKAEKSAQLLASKINELPATDPQELKPPVQSVSLKGADLKMIMKGRKKKIRN